MRTLLACLLMMPGMFTHAQQKVFEFSSMNDKRYTNEGHFIHGSSGNHFFLTVYNKKFVQRFMVRVDGRHKALLNQSDETDENFPVQNRIDGKILDIYDRHRYIDGLVSGTTMVEVLRQQVANNYFVIETDLQTGVSVVADTIDAEPRNEVVHTFTKNGTLHILTQKPFRDHFIIHRIRPGTQAITDTLRIAIPDPVTEGDSITAKTVNVFSMMRNERILVVPGNMWIPHHVSYRNKAYANENRFVITINSPDLTTLAVDIDLETLQHKVIRFDPFANGDHMSGPASNSSLLLDSILLTAAANRSEINFSIFKSRTGELLHQKRISNESIGGIKSSPIEKVGDFWARSNVSEIGFEEFLEKATHNQLSLTGYKEKDQLYLTFGTTYQRLTSASFVGNLLTLWTGGFSETKPAAIVSFNASFQMPNFSASNLNTRNFMWEKILFHLWGARNVVRSFNGLSAFYMKGFIYLGYYNTVTRKYAVYRFDEKAE